MSFPPERHVNCTRNADGLLAGVGAGRLFSSAETKNFALIGFKDFETVAFEIELFAGSGNFAADVAEEAGDGGDSFIGFFAEVNAKDFFDTIDGCAAPEEKAAVGFFHQLGCGVKRVLGAFADNFFDEIFESGDAGDGTMFINDDGHRLILLTHFLEQFGSDFGLGHEKDGTHQFANLAADQIGIGNLQEILRVDDTLEIVERFFEYGNAREASLDDFCM
jgi:hypothetical protein